MIELDDAEDDWVIINIETPVGRLAVAGGVVFRDRVLHIEGAHVGGLNAGALGRAGLNAIGRKLLEVADVDQIVIQGANRASGPS